MRDVMRFGTMLFGFALAATACRAPAQGTDAGDWRDGFARWEKQWQTYTAAAMQARKEGKVPKGSALPADVLELQTQANAERDRFLAKLNEAKEPPPAAWGFAARMQEASSQFGAAVASYERMVAGQPLAQQDPATLFAASLAALNSKTPKVAARWMEALLERERDVAPARRRGESVRTSYYPRVLLELGALPKLTAHVQSLLDDEASPAARAAGMQFALLLDLQKHDLAAVDRRVKVIRGDAQAYPDQQAWAVLVELALKVHAGEYVAGQQLVDDWLKATAAEEPKSAVAKNQRRYVAAVAPFLNRPAPPVHVDTWVGETALGKEPLAELKGSKAVLLDFWQPWCEPCRNAMPAVVALQKKYDGLQVLGLCCVEDYGYDVSARQAVRPIEPEDYPAHVADFRSDMQLNYPLGIADKRVNNETFKVAGIPTIVVIDRTGIVRYMSCGAGEAGLMELAVAGVMRHSD